MHGMQLHCRPLPPVAALDLFKGVPYINIRG